MPRGVADSPTAKRALKKCNNVYVFSVDDIKMFKLSNARYNNNIEGDLVVGMKSEVHMENKIVEGFLNVGENVQGLTNWNRRWCHLDGLEMSMYNYPTDDRDSQNEIFHIDLSRSVQDRVELADRSICARPRTFTLNIFRQSSSTNNEARENVQTYFFSADNVNDLRLWLTELDNKLNFLREWQL